MNSELWLKEIMSLSVPKLTQKDPTKVLLIYYFLENDGFNRTCLISDVNKYIYRFYIDNQDIAKKHPSIVINNISHYGTNDILFFTKQALGEWKNDFKDGCLEYDDENIFVTIKDINEDTLIYTKNIADMLYQKFTNNVYNYDVNLTELKEIRNFDLEKINKSRLKNRVLEDIQYCVCCDEENDLMIINLSNDANGIIDKNNYVTVCKKHYELFLNGYFKFNDIGYIIINKTSKELNEKMHISNFILNNKRREYLSKKNK